MKAIKQLTIVTCAMAMFACNKEGTDPNGGKKGAGEPCEVYLTITTAENRGITDGFVDGTNEENAVKMLEFYVFDETTGMPDTETNATSGQEGYVKISSTEKTHKIKMTGGDKIIVAVINMDLGVPATNTYTGLKAEMAKWEYFHNSTDGYNARTENRTLGFEMTGEREFSIVSGSANNSISVNVARVSSRINAPTFTTSAADFINLLPEHYDEIWGTDVADIEGKSIEFVNEGYVVINGRSNSDAFFKGNASGNDREITTTVVAGVTYNKPAWPLWSATNKAVCNSSFDASGFYTNTYSGKGTAADWFLDGSVNGEHRVYVFENKPDVKTMVVGGSTNTGYDPASTYALIVKGTFVIDGDAADANGLNRTRYWRVNLTRDDDYHVFRNSSYAITVNKISTPGEGTPKDAEEGDPIIPGKDETTADVTIVVSGWRLNEYNTDM